MAKISEQDEKIINEIKNSWLVEGYELTQEDISSLNKIASGESTCDDEVKKVIENYKKKNSEKR